MSIKKKAFSLLLTLWVVAMMSVASVLYLSYAKKVVQKSRKLQDKLTVTFEAESMIELLKYYAATGEIKLNYVSNITVQESIPKFPQKVLIDSSKFFWKNTTFSLQDSAGLIDISDVSALTRFLSIVENRGENKKNVLGSSLTDWLDDDVNAQLNGAENSFYESDGYRPRNQGFFSSIEELFLIRGMRDINSSMQESIRSMLVMSDFKKHNILTMEGKLIEQLYNINEEDIYQLNSLRLEGKLKEYMLFFHQCDKENSDLEMDGAMPSNIIKVKIVSSIKNIKKEIVLLVDFHSTESNSFRILNYKN